MALKINDQGEVDVRYEVRIFDTDGLLVNEQRGLADLIALDTSIEMAGKRAQETAYQKMQNNNALGYPMSGRYSFTPNPRDGSGRPLYPAGTHIVNLATGERGVVSDFLGQLTHLDNHPGPAAQNIYLIRQEAEDGTFEGYCIFEDQINEA